MPRERSSSPAGVNEPKAATAARETGQGAPCGLARCQLWCPGPLSVRPGDDASNGLCDLGICETNPYDLIFVIVEPFCCALSCVFTKRGKWLVPSEELAS
jgi:hypothetical protein